MESLHLRVNHATTADAQVFIVASSIEDSFGVINYDRAARLADLIHHPS